MIQISSSFFWRDVVSTFMQTSHKTANKLKSTHLNRNQGKPLIRHTHRSIHLFWRTSISPAFFLHSSKFISIPFSATSHHLVATTARLFLLCQSSISVYFEPITISHSETTQKTSGPLFWKSHRVLLGTRRSSRLPSADSSSLRDPSVSAITAGLQYLLDLSGLFFWVFWLCEAKVGISFGTKCAGLIFETRIHKIRTSEFCVHCLDALPFILFVDLF